MSQDTTTIEIRDDQQEALSDLKQHDRESYKAVLDRLLDGEEATEPVAIEDVVGREMPLAEIQEQLDSIESSVNTVETRTNSIDRKVEELR